MLEIEILLKIDREVFNFWINQKGNGDTYEYFVIPNVSLASVDKTANHSLDAIQILTNTPKIQAVYHSGM